MKKELQNQDQTPPQEGGDTCGGVPKPSSPPDHICVNGKWEAVDVPNLKSEDETDV